MNLEQSGSRWVGAAILLLLCGLAILSGSLMGWDTCPKVPCEGSFGFFVLWERSGMDVGAGVVTAEIGFLLTIVGVSVVRRRGVLPFRSEAIGLAFLALLTIAAYAIRTYVFREFSTYGPQEGLYLIAIGGLLAAIASARLRPSDQASRERELAHRPSLALLIIGMAAWAIGLSGHLGFRVELLAYAVVLVALGLGLWPGLLPGTRLRPTTAGLLLLLYGAFWLAVAPFAGAGRGPLEAFPFAILLAVVAMRVLDLPIATPRGEPSDSRVEAVLTAMVSPSGLRVAALLLTNVTLVLLVARILLAGRLPPWLYALEGRPTNPAWLAWLLVAGLVIAGGTAIALSERPVRLNRLVAVRGPGSEHLASSGAAVFWLLLGIATGYISLLALMYSVGALVLFGPWTIVCFAIAARVLIKPPERREMALSTALAVVSLALSVIGVVGTIPQFLVYPIVLAILSVAALAYSVLGLIAPTITGDRPTSSGGWADAAIWAQRAGLVVLFGGLAIVVGSFTTWGACSGIPCEGPGQLFMIWERTGVSFGPGIVTALLGLLMVALGIDATRGRDRAVPAEVPIGMASVVLVVVIGFVMRVHLVPLYKLYGGFEGPILVGAGAIAALLASLRQRRARLRGFIE